MKQTIAQLNANGGTGFKRHIDCIVEKEGDRPIEHMEYIKSILGPNFKEKWFHIEDKENGDYWTYSAGI
jgi:hypothetical protein